MPTQGAVPFLTERVAKSRCGKSARKGNTQEVFVTKMTKKIFALVMVISVIGGILAGCSAPAEDTTKAKETAGATTAGAAETKKDGE